MPTVNPTLSAEQLVDRYNAPTPDQHAAASAIQGAFREKFSGITSSAPPSQISSRPDTPRPNDFRQLATNDNGPSVSQLSHASTPNTVFSRMSAVCDALAKGVLSESPTIRLQIHCTASIELLATKVPTLRALATRMTPENAPILKSVLTAVGQKIGRGDWFKASYLRALNGNPDQRAREGISVASPYHPTFSASLGSRIDPAAARRFAHSAGHPAAAEADSNTTLTYAAFGLGITIEKFKTLAVNFDANPIRPEETISLAALALQVKQSMRQGSEPGSGQDGFLRPSWCHHPDRILTLDQIEALTEGAGRYPDTVHERFLQLDRQG